MITELLDIEPRELKFTFELKKQSSCSVRLVNKSDHHVAFKVKTTSPKKYCVRPNTGVIKPNSQCDFIVTMQAQKSAPSEMTCKDKFLIQSTIVPADTLDEDITASIFAKDVKYVEESKLRVILASPPHSPLLSPINGTERKIPTYEASLPKDYILNEVEDHDTYDVVPDYEASFLKDELLSASEASFSYNTVTEDAQNSKMENDDVDSKKSAEVKATRNVEVKATRNVEVKATRDVEELKLVKEIEVMKSKLNGLESKLSEAEGTISKLVEERRLTAKGGESLLQELEMLRSKKGGGGESESERKVEVVVGFPLLFVVMVALLSTMFGYLLNS